jgi:hypothetical protein
MLSLFAIWGVSRRWLPDLEAGTFTAVTAFGLYVYKSAYAQAEILFYTLSFFAFLSALHFLRRPSWLMALLAGALVGVAHLTKASMLPFLVLLLAWSLVGFVVEFVRRQPSDRSIAMRCKRPIATLLLVVSFLVVVFPYIQTSHERFGQWFYNVNSTFYVWCDSKGEANAKTKRAGDTLHWPNMPPEKIPSFQKYLREHTPGQILDRISRGHVVITRALRTQQPAATCFLVLYACLMLAIGYRARSKLWRALLDDGRWIVSGFVVSFLAVYWNLYAFYFPIARGPRLILTLFLPAIFCMLHLSSRPLFRELLLFGRGRISIRPRTWHFGMLAVLGIIIVSLYPYWILNKFTGN